VYTLGARGKRLIEEDQGVAPSTRLYGPQTPAPLFLEHILAISEFRINLELALVGSGHRLELWLDDVTLRKMAAREGPVSFGSAHVSLPVPDGYGRVSLASGHRFCFFLEMDRGTQDRKAIVDKLMAYVWYWTSGAYYRQYQTRSLSVLVVVSAGSEDQDNRRVEQLATWAEEASPPPGEDLVDLFWFAPLAEARANQLLTQPIWQVTGRSGRHYLLPPQMKRN